MECDDSNRDAEHTRVSWMRHHPVMCRRLSDQALLAIREDTVAFIDGYDDAIIGVHVSSTQGARLVYHYERLVTKAHHHGFYEEFAGLADEYIDFNVLRQVEHMGASGPLIVSDTDGSSHPVKIVIGGMRYSVISKSCNLELPVECEGII